MNDSLTVYIGVRVLFATMLIVLYFCGAAWIGSTRCNTLEYTSGINTRYTGIFTGCYVKVNGKYIPQDNWRGEYEQP